MMLPSGYVEIAIENGPVEIVYFPIKHGDCPSCKGLPEAKCHWDIRQAIIHPYGLGLVPQGGMIFHDVLQGCAPPVTYKLVYKP